MSTQETETKTLNLGSKTALKYLDDAIAKVQSLGLWPEKVEEAPVAGLLAKISELDADKVLLIGRTLNQASVFNQLVRDQVAGMEIAQRYEDITNGFNSIRDDAKKMVGQLEDGKIDMMERINNVVTKVVRGDISSRFDKIRSTYLEVAKDSNDQINREHKILEAYLDFRGALKQSEILALEVLEIGQKKLDEAKALLMSASKELENLKEGSAADRAKLELARDEKLRDMQAEDRRYQVAKDISDNLTIAYNTSEVVMARLMQTTNAKERVYQQAVAFFSTNETVLTALRASFTGMWGLHESTKTLEAMKEGVSQSLETLADIGGKVQEAALKAGYGPTVRSNAVIALVDSVVSFQERSLEIIDEMRKDSTRNAAEIRDAVEDGKKRLSKLAAEGNAALLEVTPRD